MKNLAGSGHCVQELPVNIVTYGVQDRWTTFTEKGGVGRYFSYLVVMWYRMIIEKMFIQSVTQATREKKSEFSQQELNL